MYSAANARFVGIATSIVLLLQGGQPGRAAESSFCDDVKSFTRLAVTDFASIRGDLDRDLSDDDSQTYSALRVLPNARRCYIEVYAPERESVYRCSWKFLQLEDGQDSFSALVESLRTCHIGAGQELRKITSEKQTTYSIEDDNRVRVSVRFSKDRDARARISFSVHQDRQAD